MLTLRRPNITRSLLLYRYRRLDEARAAADGRFDIAVVMGPDEFHDGYPDHPGGGLRNNAYTNVLASWDLARAGEAVALVSERDGGELCRHLPLRAGELGDWDRVSRRLRVPFHTDGIISQFEGYEALKEFDCARYRARYDDIARLDLIRKAEGDTTNGYKLSKRADALMLFYVLSAEELGEVFAGREDAGGCPSRCHGRNI